jgi:hypothetical protein
LLLVVAVEVKMETPEMMQQVLVAGPEVFALELVCR